MPKIVLSRIESRAQRRLLTGAAIVFGTLLLLSLFAWLAGPPIVRSFVAEQIGLVIGRKVSFGDVKINPLKLSMSVRDLVIFEPDQMTKLVSVDELYLDASIASFRRLAPVLDELRVRAPVLRIVRVSDQRFNFSDILDKLAERPESDPARFSLNNIQISEGQIHYDDGVRQSKNAITELRLTLPFLSNLPYAAELFATPAFSAKVNGSPLVIEGKTLPFAPSLQSALQINIDALQLPHYMPFSPVAINGALASGLMDTRLQFDFQRNGDQQNLVLTGSITLRDVKITDNETAPLAQWKSLTIGLERSEPLGRDFRIKDVRFDTPEVWIARAADGSLNLQKLLVAPARVSAVGAAPQPAVTAAPRGPDTARVFSAGQIAIAAGRVHVRDAVPGAGKGQPAALELKDIAASVSGFSTAAGSEAALALTLMLNDGANIKTDVTLRYADQTAQGNLVIAGLKPQDFQAYFATLFAGQLGKTELDGNVNFQAAWPQSGLQLVLKQSAAKLRNLQVGLPAQKTAAINAREISFEGMQLDLAGRTASLELLTVTGAEVKASRDASGKLDLMALLPASPSSPAANPDKVSAAPWQAMLKKLSVVQGSLAFNDAAVALHNEGKSAQTQWRSINANLANLNWPLTAGKNVWPLDVKFNDAKNGSVALAGNLTPQPLAADLKLNVRNLDVPAVQPYFAQYSNASLTSGQLSTTGRAVIGMPVDKPLRASYVGTLDLNGVRAVDRINGTDFLRWRTLSLSRVDAQINTQQNPFVLTLGEIALADFFARVILNADGRLNLADIRARPEAGAAGTSLTEASAAPANASTSGKTTVAPLPARPPSEGPDPVIRMGRIAIDKGNVNFSDFFVRPNYTTNLTSLAGSISSVSSDAPGPADINIKGRVDGDAPLSITGKANPFASQLFLDLSANAKGIELTRLTPYAAKYAGYPITKGKLTVDVKYHIENGQLVASNKLFLDQLTFGEKVDSPDATTLPVLLAVALLKNSRGEIDIDLPVSGSLSDPQFSIGGVIVRVIINLLTKAIIAPFSLIASAFGGGDAEQLSYVEFEPGDSDIGAAQQEKLATLATALNDRPGVKLEIIGRIDPVADRAGAKKAWVDRLVRAQKRRESIAQGAGGADVLVKPEEYAKYLDIAYKSVKFEKPRPAGAKPPTVAEMEAQLIEHAPIGEAQLKMLADRRAQRVKSYLEEKGKIAVERLFLVASKLNTEGIKDKGSPSRVDFAMQL